MAHLVGPNVNMLMSAAVLSAALCAGCANEPDEPAAAPVESTAPTTTTASHSKYPGGPLTFTVIVPDIAIYEQRATEFNDAVVQSMQPLR